MEKEEIYTLTSNELEEVKHHPIMCQKESHIGELCGCEVAALLEKIKRYYTEGLESKEAIMNMLNTRSRIEVPQIDGKTRVWKLQG